MWRAEVLINSIHRGIQKQSLVVAIDHDGCGKLINQENSEKIKDALNSLIGTICDLKKKSKTENVILCSFSNRQTKHLNEIMSKPGSLDHLETIHNIFKGKGLDTIIHKEYFCEDDYKEFQTIQEVSDFEKSNRKRLLVKKILEKYQNCSFLFVDDKYDNLPPHDEAVNHIHFSPAIWPRASNLNEKMFHR